MFNVRSGSKGDIGGRSDEVCYASKNGHCRATPACPRNDCEVRRQERTAVALPEEIIVFDAGGPIRGETVLKAHADHSAPMGPLCLPEADEGIEDVEALACDGSAALVSLLPNAG